MKGLDEVMKQAQQMQEKMQAAQQQIATMEVTGESGAGMVAVTMTGRHDVKRVNIDASLMTEDKEVLEDLIAAAINDAVRKVEKSSQRELGDIAAGIPLPDGFKMPF